MLLRPTGKDVAATSAAAAVVVVVNPLSLCSIDLQRTKINIPCACHKSSADPIYSSRDRERFEIAIKIVIFGCLACACQCHKSSCCDSKFSSGEEDDLPQK